MRILMVSRHGCIRVWKEAVALKKRGHTVDLLAQEVPFGFDRLDTLGIYHDPDQLRRSVEASRAEIIHVHNEPDWMVSECRKATARPIIFDVHDLESLRWQRPPNEDEEAAFAAADGYVHTSDLCAEAAAKYHSPKPTVILPCFMPEGLYCPDDAIRPGPAWSSIVYEGGLSTSKTNGEDNTVDMRGLEPVVEAFVRQGFGFYLFPAREKNFGAYEDLGATVCKPTVYPSLLLALRTFGFGFVGASTSVPLMESAMPNKLFEYMSQGVVPAVWNAGRAASFVRDEGVGIALEGLENLHRQLADAAAVRQRMLTRRREWTMERHIHLIESLYHQVLGRNLAEPEPVAVAAV